MIGAVVYRLRALRGARLPLFHGRFLHAAAFHLLERFREDLSETVHDEMNIKPFSLGLLQGGQRIEKGAMLSVRSGDTLYWRAVGLCDDVLQAFLAVPCGLTIEVGRAAFSVEEVLCDGTRESGVAAETDLIAGALAADDVRSIRFTFTSPVSFRSFRQDYPFPLPELIFGSLADQWTQMAMPAELDAREIRSMTTGLCPLEWQGGSRRVYFGHDRGVLACEGKYAFDISPLPAEIRQVLVLLGQYAVFAGVGRLTSQGFGQVRVSFA